MPTRDTATKPSEGDRRPRFSGRRTLSRGVRSRSAITRLAAAWTLTTLLVIGYVFYADVRRAALRMDGISESLVQRVSDLTLVAETTLEGFAAFVRSLDRFDHDRATDYARQLLDRYAFLHRLAVVERVPGSERPVREQMMAAIYPGFEIRDFSLDTDRSWRRAPARADHYPVVFQEPRHMKTGALGLDIAGESRLWQALLTAAREHRPVATQPYCMIDGEIGYALFRSLESPDSATIPTSDGANSYAVLALKPSTLFAAFDAAPEALAVRLSHIAYQPDDPHGFVVSRQSERPASDLERQLLPLLQRQSTFDSSAKPFVLTMDWQLGWQDLSIAEAIVIGVLSLLLFQVVSQTMRVFFQREILAMERHGRLYEMANFDALTGLANRKRLLDKLESAVIRARHARGGVGLLFIDVDRFNLVNDRLGHTLGDAVLVEVATRLGRHLPEGATLGRYGGDEFMLVIDDVRNSEDLRFLVRRLKHEMDAPIPVSGKLVDVGISVGVATYPADGLNAQAMINCADRAMFRDKKG